MKNLILIHLVMVMGCIGTASSVFGDSPSRKLVVHEWGVVRVGFSSGKPILGNTDERLNAIPKFAYRNEDLAPAKFTEQLLEFEKPVLHFYGKEGQQVELTVSISKGLPLVYFPKPELGRRTITTIRDGRFGDYTHTNSMTWRFSLSKGNPGGLPAPPEGHWWNTLRRVPSDYIKIAETSETERFVFYEATSAHGPMITASMDSESIVLKNLDTNKSAPVVLLLNDGGKRLGVFLDGIAQKDTVQVSKDMLETWTEEKLIEQCSRQWIACGMTKEEASGIVESWRTELLETPGFLLISQIPRPVYDKIFPIVVVAKDAEVELTRSCMVFDTLAGQEARLSWTPGITTKCRTALGRLNAENFKERMAAHSELVSMGDIIVPIIKEALASSESDLHTKAAAQALLVKLTESQVCAKLLSEETEITRGLRRFVK